MELKEFIKKSTQAIMAGMLESETKKHKFGINNDNGNGIEFDIAITTEKGGEGKLEILDIGTSGHISNSNVHRVKFTLIPRGK